MRMRTRTRTRCGSKAAGLKGKRGRGLSKSAFWAHWGRRLSHTHILCVTEIFNIRERNSESAILRFQTNTTVAALPLVGRPRTKKARFRMPRSLLRAADEEHPTHSW